MYENILEYFPEKIKEILKDNLSEKDFLEEIRLRCEKPVILKYCDRAKKLNYILSKSDIDYIFERICENSIYTYQNQICERIYNYKRWT